MCPWEESSRPFQEVDERRWSSPETLLDSLCALWCGSWGVGNGIWKPTQQEEQGKVGILFWCSWVSPTWLSLSHLLTTNVVRSRRSVNVGAATLCWRDWPHPQYISKYWPVFGSMSIVINLLWEPEESYRLKGKKNVLIHKVCIEFQGFIERPFGESINLPGKVVTLEADTAGVQAVSSVVSDSLRPRGL